MKHEKIKEQISLYIEGELDETENRLIREHLEECPDCQREFQKMNRLEEVLQKMELKKPSEEIWKMYWSSVYNKLERNIGWILLSVGSIILIFMGGYKAVEGLIQDPNISVWLKAGILAFMGGIIVLLVSCIREQLFLRKRERYKEVEK